MIIYTAALLTRLQFGPKKRSEDLRPLPDWPWMLWESPFFTEFSDWGHWWHAEISAPCVRGRADPSNPSNQASQCWNERTWAESRMESTPGFLSYGGTPSYHPITAGIFFLRNHPEMGVPWESSIWENRSDGKQYSPVFTNTHQYWVVFSLIKFRKITRIQWLYLGVSIDGGIHFHGLLPQKPSMGLPP